MSLRQGRVCALRAKKLLHAVLLLAILSCLACRAFPATCNVVHQPPPTDADKAFLAADYAKAQSLYRQALTASPGKIQLTTGLVHALLRDQKVQEAADAIKTALAAAPNLPALLTLRGEVELRQGEPWTASKTADESLKLDPCNPRTQLLAADLARIGSYYASARKHVEMAHQLGPDDPEIREEWLTTLPAKQRIPELEAYLAEPRGDDAEEVRSLKDYLEHLRKYASEPRKPCKLVSQTKVTQIPLGNIMRDAQHIEGFGLDVKLNNHTSRLEVDTGAGGILVTSAVAKRAGLQAFSPHQISGIGDEGNRSGYTAFADSIRIGDLEFQNCAVRVIDGRYLPDLDGLIGMNVLSQFLVTLDYPERKLLLGPLPPRPGEDPGLTVGLKTAADEESDDGYDAAQIAAQPAAGAADASAAAQKPAPHGPYDRYIAPEMKDYTPVFRVGHDLILPASLNDSKIKLFILDTGAWATTISPQAAREVTKVYELPGHASGISGEVKKMYTADKITFRFANVSQDAENVPSFDTAKISKDEGMEISGLIGANTLFQLTIHIDYRDGLVKFDYDPKHGYH